MPSTRCTASSSSGRITESPLRRSAQAKRRAEASPAPNSLAARLHGEPLPALDAIRTAIGIAEALKHWHDREQPYGCLIPAAVFGEAASVELAPQRLTGPSPYRAPELWLGAEADARSDIFALGAICHEMFSGRAPFGGPDETSLKRAVLERPPAALEDAPP